MVADKLKTQAPLFTVENNIYKGLVEPFTSNYKSIGEMIWKNIKTYKDKIIQLDSVTEETVTYAQLQEKTVKCALWLQERGIKSGDVISVCTHNHVNSFVPCLAAMYINAIFNPWDEDMNKQTALHCMRLTTPKVIFCNEKSASIISDVLKEEKCNPTVVIFGNRPNMIPFADILNSCNDSKIANFRYVELDDIKKTACIMHSSGTTGLPKGVELSNYCLILISEDKNIDMTNTVPLWFSSLYWISGVILNLKAINQGAKIIICMEFDEEKACILTEKYKVTWMLLSTSMTSRFLKAGYVKNYPLLSLKLIFCGGAILKAEVQAELKQILPHVTFLQAYGMTELGGVVTSQLPHHKNGSCGVITKNAQMKVIDPDSKKVLSPNQSGELCIKAATMMNGYFKNPKATRETFDEEGWLHTGDLVCIDEDGELFVIDRLKELIKYRGHQISPAEIETVLLTHPAVLEVGIVSVSHDIDDEHPMAYITKKPGVKVTEQEIIDFVAKNMMDHHKLRAGVVFLDIFPYTGSGKIAKKELRAMAKELVAKRKTANTSSQNN